MALLLVIAHIYKGLSDGTALRTASFKPMLWLSSVDETFVIWNHDNESLEKF